MSAFGRELVKAGKSRYGRAFLHHFKPNLCRSGLETVETCWEQGLDDEGYDCSGFVIASLCDVLKLDVDEWPRDQRHVRQLAKTTQIVAVPNAGDVIFMADPANQERVHAGIYTGNGRMLHADGRKDFGAINEAIIARPQVIRSLSPQGVGTILAENL